MKLLQRLLLGLAVVDVACVIAWIVLARFCHCQQGCCCLQKLIAGCKYVGDVCAATEVILCVWLGLCVAG
jgi:hypothetical protein